MLQDIPEIVTLAFVKDHKSITDSQDDSILLQIVNETNSQIYTDIISKTDIKKLEGTNKFIQCRNCALLFFEANYVLRINRDKDLHDVMMKRYEAAVAKLLNSIRKFSRFSTYV